MVCSLYVSSLSYQKNRPRLGVQTRDNNAARQPNLMPVLHSWLTNTQSNNQSEDRLSLAFGDIDSQ